jgi:hypothetical protein
MTLRFMRHRAYESTEIGGGLEKTDFHPSRITASCLRCLNWTLHCAYRASQGGHLMLKNLTTHESHREDVDADPVLVCLGRLPLEDHVGGQLGS